MSDHNSWTSQPDLPKIMTASTRKKQGLKILSLGCPTKHELIVTEYLVLAFLNVVCHFSASTLYYVEIYVKETIETIKIFLFRF